MNKKLNMKTKFKTQKIKTLEPKPKIRIHAKNTNPANLKPANLNKNTLKPSKFKQEHIIYLNKNTNTVKLIN